MSICKSLLLLVLLSAPGVISLYDEDIMSPMTREYVCKNWNTMERNERDYEIREKSWGNYGKLHCNQCINLYEQIFGQGTFSPTHMVHNFCAAPGLNNLNGSNKPFFEKNEKLENLYRSMLENFTKECRVYALCQLFENDAGSINEQYTESLKEVFIPEILRQG